MILSFFESIKYVGHFFPIALLRMYIGWGFFASALAKKESDYLLQPKLAAAINDFLPLSSAPLWYREFLDSVVVPHWQIFAYSIMYFEFLIGIGLILGFLSRPLSLIAAFLALNYLYTSSPDVGLYYRMLVVVCVMMAWVGAGRCLGMDFFFFKRQRGLLW